GARGHPGETSQAGHDHDLAPAPLEVRQREVRRVHTTEIVHVHEALVDREVKGLVEARHHARARVVDEDVEAAEGLDGTLHQTTALVEGGDVGGDDDRLRARGPAGGGDL